jgi:flagella basal body P-ring formation protein FlgA
VKGPGLARPLLAYARVERRQMVVIAVRPIAVGDFVRATDVELRSYAGNVSTRAAASLDAVIGKEATQAIRPETIVMTSQVRSPLLVRRGERVSVRARAAGVLVRTYATAQQDGSLGDLIQVQTLEGRERYAARVAGLRELEVFAAGTSASDVAAFGQ